MKLFAVVLAMVVMLIHSGSAHARKPDKVKARKLLAEGESAFGRSDFRVAVTKFKQAYAAWNYPTLHFNIAYAYAMLGEKLQAVTHLRAYQNKVPASQQAAVPELLKYMKRTTGLLIVQAPDTIADIFIDGKRVGAGRVEQVVHPGKRTIDIKWKDNVAVRKIIEVFPGGEKTWKLERKPPPRLRPRLRPRPRPRPIPPPPRVRRGVHWGYFVAVASVAAALAAAAVGTGLHTWNLRSQFEDDPTEGLLDKGNRFRNLTNGLWGAAGATAVTAAILAIFTRWRGARRERVRISPRFGNGAVGLSVTIAYP